MQHSGVEYTYGDVEYAVEVGDIVYAIVFRTRNVLCATVKKYSMCRSFSGTNVKCPRSVIREAVLWDNSTGVPFSKSCLHIP